MIEVRSLQKTYRSHGAAVGLLGADFLVPDGQIVGILGENGAGKTTMLRCIAGLLPHKGTALLDGRPAGVQYERISYITGEGSYYPALTVAAYGQLLTDRQREIADLYWSDDLSLGEIAEITGLSRQGVRASLEKTRTILGTYEEKLGLAQRFSRAQELTEQLQRELTFPRPDTEKLRELCGMLGELYK